MDALSGAPTKRRRKVRGLEVVDGGKATFVAGVSYTDGRPDPCLHNATVLLRERHERARWWVWDDFSGRLLVREPGKADRPLEEADELDVAAWLQSVWNTRFAVGVAQSALRRIAFAQRVDTLVEHVRRVKWDGVARVDGWAVRYLGAEDTPYHREVGRVWLLSMAARALRPGCKVDTVPVLEGGQGKRKSTIVEALGRPFFAELEATVGTKDAAEQLAGAWCVEIGELDGLSKAEVNAIKAFISRRDDRFRRAYARNVTCEPRRSVMIGTTNLTAYLSDPTGARRFLPLTCGVLDVAGLEEARAQLIAEAVARVDGGEAWWTTDPALVEAQKVATSERRKPDAWDDRIAAYTAVRERVTVGEVLDHIGVEAAHRAGHHANRVAEVLMFLGFRRQRFQREIGRPWGYVRETSSANPTATPPEFGSDGVEKGESFREVPHQPHRTPPESQHSTRARARRGQVLDPVGSVGSMGYPEKSDGVEAGQPHRTPPEQTFAEWLEDEGGEP